MPQLTSQSSFLAIETAGNEASFPIDFKLISRFGGQDDGQACVLYSRVPVQSLDLEIHNTSRGTMTISPASTTFNPAADTYFYLTFRPGVLWDTGIVLSPVADFDANAGWVLEHDRKRTDKCFGYYLYRQPGADALPAFTPSGEPLKVQIGNIQIDGSGGSRSTNVELTYKNIPTNGYDRPLSGSRQKHLAIMDELPTQGRPPIAVQWVTSSAAPLALGNQVLNDRATQNTPTLRLLNQSGHDLALTTNSQITLHLPEADNTPWGLIKQTDITSVGFGAPSSPGRPGRGNFSALGQTWQATPAAFTQFDPTEGGLMVKLQPGAAATFANKAYIDIPITLQCSAPDGTAQVLVHYEGFGGLADEVVAEVLKTPLIMSGSKVGVGTTSPQQSLSVQGGMNIDQANKGDGTLDSNALTFGTNSSEGITSKRVADGCTLSFYTNNAERMTITHDGKVGVGTTNPQQSLSVQGGMNIDQANKGDGTLNSNALTFGTNSGEGITSKRVADGCTLSFYTNNAERMTITHDGKVGIGTKNPQGLLDILGEVKTGVGTVSTPLVGTTVTGNGAKFLSAGIRPGDRLVIGNDVRVITEVNGDTSLTIDSPFSAVNNASFSYIQSLLIVHADLDKVGIGTASPQQSLSVQGGMNIDQANKGDGTLNSNALTFGTNSGEGITSKRVADGCTLSFYTNNAERMTITHDGNVRIGANPTDTKVKAKLVVNGSVTMHADYSYMLGKDIFGMGILAPATKNPGQISIWASDAILASELSIYSDARIKTNVQTLDGDDSLAFIGKLRPVSFEYADKVQKGCVVREGFIAQEVEKLRPSLVRTGVGMVPVLKPFADYVFEDGVKYQIATEIGMIAWKKGDTVPPGEKLVVAKEVEDFRSLDYDSLFSIAVAAIQKQQSEIEQLKAEVRQLKSIGDTTSVEIRLSCEEIVQPGGS